MIANGTLPARRPAHPDSPVAVSAANKHLVTMPGKPMSLAEYNRRKAAARRDGPGVRQVRYASGRAGSRDRQDMRRSVAVHVEHWME